MALKVIGSGFGRTGTTTVKDALGVLGYGSTHSMVELLQHPAQIDLWKAHMAGQTVDWNDVFAGYQSQMDWPGAAVWEQLFAVFPDALVLHTERPEDAWWDSFNRTIGKLFRLAETLPMSDHRMDVVLAMRDGLVGEILGDYTDRDRAIAAYRANNARVRQVVPDGQLLVYNVADGWEPLCTFLDVPDPETEFPHHNIRAGFWEFFGGEPADA